MSKYYCYTFAPFEKNFKTALSINKSGYVYYKLVTFQELFENFLCGIYVNAIDFANYNSRYCCHHSLLAMKSF